jgi:23S rRNA C2498 (ribose-2'-O)-methylase RlmM
MKGKIMFDEELRRHVHANAKRLEVVVAKGMLHHIFEDLIIAVSEKTNGKGAAVLIDEYDAPLLQVLSKNGGQMDERVVETRALLHTFLLTLKSNMDLTHCQLITGATSTRWQICCRGEPP